MGLFGKSAPASPPRVRRADLAAAIKDAPPQEMERLSWAQPELDYLAANIPADEAILGAASCSDTASVGVSLGVMALTATRIVAIVSARDKGGPRGRPVGQPNVYSMDLKQLSEFYFGTYGIRGVHGCAVTLRVAGSGQLVFSVGQDDRYAKAFLDLATRHMNKAKLT